MKTGKELVVQQFNGNEIRTKVDEAGEVWFVSQDVMSVLGIKNQRHALRKLDDSERGEVVLPSSGQNRAFSAVSESGLYGLVLQSRLKSAKDFRLWITKEVLPSIRKTGSYSVKEVDPIEQLKMHLAFMERQRAEVQKLNENLALVSLEAKQLDDTLTSDQIGKLDLALMKRFKQLGGKDYRIMGLMRKRIKQEFFEITGSRTYKEIPRSGFDKALSIVNKFEVPAYLSDAEEL